MPIDPPLLSDHAFVIADCFSQTPASSQADVPLNYRQVRNWRGIDIDAFAADLEQSSLVVMPTDDVIAAFECYNSTLLTLLNKHAPLRLKRVNTRPSARWYDNECRVIKRKTRTLERTYRRLRSTESLAAWRAQFESQRQLYESKFTSFWLSTVEENNHNPLALWRAVNTLLQPPPKPASSLLSVDDFATFFQGKIDNISTSTAPAAPPNITTRQVSPLSNFEAVTADEIVKLLNTTPCKSCCLDPIPTWLLKRLSTNIAPVISRLCNLSMKSGVFPISLKQACVIPLLKKSNLDPDIASSYRPISNLSYLSKVIERVAASRFKSHISTHSLFPAQQSAYRSFHSTETAILSVHNDLVRATDNGQITALVLLDLSAAFDTVDHDILLSVLWKRFSITDTVFNWCQSYLNDRTQAFSFANRISSSYIVSCSVPQGSVFGPLEFEAYTEDIVEVLNKHAMRSHLYADDTQLYTSCQPKDIDETRSRLSDCVNDVALWCASRRLKLNTEKTDFIWFGSRANLKKVNDRECSFQAGSDMIQPSTVVRNLGVLFDAELSMKQHVAKVASTCFYHLRRLRQIRRRVGAEVTTQLVLAFITSRLDYCNSILAGVPQTTLEPLQRVQNAAVRLIFELGLREHVTPGLLQLHWLPVRWRIQFKLCMMMYSIRTAKCPTYLNNMVATIANSSSRSGLRSSTATDLYVTPRLRTKLGERAFSYAGPAAWNALPVSIRSDSSQTQTQFKKLLKTHFFSIAFID